MSVGHRIDRKGPSAHDVVVLDFETTGLSPGQGDRAIEIGAVRLQGGVVVDRFQELMNPGFRISSFIVEYTGITQDMLDTAAPCTEVMTRFSDFLGQDPFVAHNASFDSRFLDAELQYIGRQTRGVRLCSMLTARRLYPHAPNHKLGTLVHYRDVEVTGAFHRALADAEMTAGLWNRMLSDISADYGLTDISVPLMDRLSRTPKKAAAVWLKTIASA
ncbi:MAG: DNA polymerase-3 subunit epsilon [Myxococcota bacterium]|jgi:DNA polymerase-3 subunit epsilon